MSNKLKTIFFLCTIGCLHFGCKHDKKKDNGGRVVLVNSDTGVPSALMRFLKLDDGGSWVQSYTQVGSAITDANGYFDAPDDLDASIARAYGLDSIYENPSYDVGYGDNMRLELVPPAWLSVTVVDLEPLNPEVIGTHASLTVNGWESISLNEATIFKTYGNSPIFIKYKIYFEDLTYEYYSIQLQIAPFDTTSYIIQY